MPAASPPLAIEKVRLLIEERTTRGGRLFDLGVQVLIAVLRVGLGFVAVPPGLIAAALSEARREEREGRALNP